MHYSGEGNNPDRPVHWSPIAGAGGARPLPMPDMDTEYRGAAASTMSPNSYSPGPEYNPSNRYGGSTGGSARYSFSRPDVGR